MLDQLLELVRGFEVQLPIAILDIALTAVLIYGLFSLIRGTRAVRLVIGVTVLYAIYVAAQTLGLQLLSQILQAGAVVGLLALVVVFQPELRRALERIGRVGSFGWLLAPTAQRTVEHVATSVARAAAILSADKIGALIVLERETGLQDAAETGVMVEAELTVDLLTTIFTPRAPLHDGAVIVRGDRIVAAGCVLPLSETALYRERFGTRHRAAVGITEGTDALAVVASEETGAVSLVVRGRIIRNLDEGPPARGAHRPAVAFDHPGQCAQHPRGTAAAQPAPPAPGQPAAPPPPRPSASRGRPTPAPASASAHDGPAE